MLSVSVSALSGSSSKCTGHVRNGSRRAGVILGVRDDGINLSGGPVIIIKTICESRSLQVSVCCINAGIFKVIQLVQAGFFFRLLLSQEDTTLHPHETGGLQEESLEAARFSDAGLSFRRKIVQLSHEQRVVGGQGAVLLQDHNKIAEGESVAVIIPGSCAENNDRGGIREERLKFTYSYKFSTVGSGLMSKKLC